MNINDIPVRVVGPGSQPVQEGDEITYMDMPGDMAKYAAPLMPDPEDVMHLDGARETMQWLRTALARYTPGAVSQFANLSSISAECRKLVNQVLGEGEVSVTCNGDVVARTQESVLAGVWRTLIFDAEGKVACDLLEVSDVPQVVQLASVAGRPVNAKAEGVGGEQSNALPILVELKSRCEDYAADRQPHSINLSLLPLSDAELEFLDERLGRGPIHVLSRAYGKCEVISTETPNAWWVRYYNSMGTLILNSLEVAAVPNVVAAAPEDLRDSAKRLEEILRPYWTDVA